MGGERREREKDLEPSVPFSSVTQSSCPIPWTAARQASLSITNTRSLFKLMSIESVMPSNYLILCCPLLLPPSIFPSIRVFSNESVPWSRWPKYWSFSFSICPSSKYSGLISLRMDWLDLFAVKGTLRSLLQHHSSKGSILPCSDSFIVQLSYPYMTTGKTMACLPLASCWAPSEPLELPFCQTLFWGAPKSLQMVTAAMKLKDAYSLEEKLGPT